jgi:hypothetical protein
MGAALFEVTQPRVTCCRVGIRRVALPMDSTVGRRRCRGWAQRCSRLDRSNTGARPAPVEDVRRETTYPSAPIRSVIS